MKKLQPIILITFFLFFSVLSAGFLDLFVYAGKPANNDHTKKLIIVRQGQGFKATSEMLHKMGIIKNPFKFKMVARIKKYDKDIKAGEYLLSSSMPPDRILGIMASGKVILHRLTIPEGCNLRQIASIIAEAGLVTEKDFLRGATDSSLVHENGINAETFEGYLFPDTYYFSKGVTPEKIISTMVKRFRSLFTPSFKQQADAFGFSIHEIVTLASIIEKETGAPFERPIISSVFHNRLKRKMRLESDPTVIYGIKDFDGNITRKHLAAPTPYNTYKIKGLPPGPIASPGIKAIEAALYPADTDFFYFVSKQDNTHKFSTSIADHNSAVRKYQLRTRVPKVPKVY